MLATLVVSMAEINKKRRIPLDEDEIPAAKHAKRTEVAYSNTTISSLIQQTGELEMILRTMQGTEVADRLKNVIEKAPLILVFGMQSAGKSTLFNHLLFGGQEVFMTGEGMATVCPTEMRCGPQYVMPRNYLYEEGKIVSFRSYSAAHAYVATRVYRGALNNYVIHIEVPSKEVFHAIDLPGHNAHNGEYIKSVRDQYLIRKETVVLHVIAANSDEENDLCGQYLTPDMDVIKVYTKVDCVLGDKHAQPVLIEKLGRSKCAVFSAKDEARVLASLNPPANTIKGVAEINQYIRSFLVKKIPAIASEYRANISEILRICSDTLNVLGHQTPNFHSKLYEVRSSIEGRIKEMFSLHDSFKADFDRKISLFLPNVLATYMNCLPSDDELVTEINVSSYGRFLNAIDWDTSAKKYHAQMLEKSLNDSVLPAIDGIVEIYERVIIASYENVRHSNFAEEAIGRLREHAIDELKSVSAELKDVVTTRVRELVHPSPWSIDQQHNKVPNVIKEITKVVIASKHQLATMDDQSIALILVKNFSHLIPRCESATKSVVAMRESVNETWMRDADTIYNIVFRTIMSTFKVLMTKLVMESQKMTVADIIEKEETVMSRKYHLDVVKICNAINAILSN